jgi:dCMP deaminase
MKEKFKEAYMDVAKRFAQLSTAERLNVGAIVVKDDRIISIGYNGMPAGWDNVCEDEVVEDNLTRLVTKTEVLHAETNAISKLARSFESGEGATMFITHSPCMDCAKMIYQAGISEVYYGEEYRSAGGIEFLKKCGLKIEQVQTTNN